MKKKGPFEWTEEAYKAFQDLKRYLTSPPVMVAPRPQEPLVLYLAATPYSASAALVAVTEEHRTKGHSNRPARSKAKPRKPHEDRNRSRKGSAVVGERTRSRRGLSKQSSAGGSVVSGDAPTSGGCKQRQHPQPRRAPRVLC